MTTATDTANNAEAGPSNTSAARLTAGASPYHESSQFRHWRYSRKQLAELRAELNGKSHEVVAKNQELEKVRPCMDLLGRERPKEVLLIK